MKRDRTAEWIKTAGLLGVSFFTFLPVYFMLVISVKDAAQFAQAPYVPTWPLHFSNFVRAWEFVGPYIGRTIFVVGVATALTVLMGSLCAFYFAQFNFTGKKLFFAYVIVLMMVPGILNLVPLYVLVTQLDAALKAASQAASAGVGLERMGLDVEPRLLNSLWALILPAIAGGQVMMIFVLRQFFEAQPGALFEAARIDGASRLQLYRHIAFPLAKPIIATMAIVNVVTMWNDYVWPLLVLQKENYTVSVGLRYLEGQNFVEYGPLMAGYLMASIPLLIMFLFSMRLFISGIASGAIKM
jgi:ABC-type glycerol-3-phosphate transport system permease component